MAYECGKFYAHQINPLPANGNPGNGGSNGIAGMLPQPHLAGGSVNLMHVQIPPAVGANSPHSCSVASAGGGGNNQQHQRVNVQAPQPPHDLIVEQIRNIPALTQLMLGCYRA